MSILQRLFGFKLKGSDDSNSNKSFVPPTNDDGAVVVEGAEAYGVQLDLDGVVHNEYQIVSQYRDMVMQPEVDSAIDDIVNAAIVVDEGNPPVSLDCSGIKEQGLITLSTSLEKRLQEEFRNISNLLGFTDKQAYEVFKRWYIDGRLYYHIIIDDKHKGKGIKELRYIDPRQIRKVREVHREKDEKTGVEVVTQTSEHFLFNERGFPNYSNNSIVSPNLGLRIEKDAVAYAHSGLIDKHASLVLSHLHKAIKPLNQLRMMEDAVVIYRIARAPERRIFYVDTGNLPKTKAEEYLRSIMTKYRNKMLYNPETGEVKDGRRHLSMLEDFWLPRREGSQGTEIDTLPGGQNLGEIEDINYFQKKLFRSLNVPYSRFEQDTGFNLGRSSEITRDELKFQKFIERVRRRFSMLFDELLGRQLQLRNFCTKEDWEKLRQGINYKFASDSYFSESKHGEILRERIELAKQAGQEGAVYYPRSYIQKDILKLTDEQIKAFDKEIEKEAEELAEKLGSEFEETQDSFGKESKQDKGKTPPKKVKKKEEQ
jgi:hypothetical protein